MIARALAAFLCASAANACEPGAERHFACTVSGGAKTVEVCVSADRATYVFGPAGRPELSLDRPVTEVHLTPWSGIGRTIWEDVTFWNEDYAYTVAAWIERTYPDDEDADIAVEVSGAIIVSRGLEEVARLDCDPGSADFPWGTALYDAKTAAGQCLDREAGAWTECHNQGRPLSP